MLGTLIGGPHAAITCLNVFRKYRILGVGSAQSRQGNYRKLRFIETYSRMLYTQKKAASLAFYVSITTKECSNPGHRVWAQK